jgi:hypothetical protein
MATSPRATAGAPPERPLRRTHASVTTITRTLTFVPESSRTPTTSSPPERLPAPRPRHPVPNAGILDEVLDWFADINGTARRARFTFTDRPNFNPVQNVDVPAGAPRRRSSRAP